MKITRAQLKKFIKDNINNLLVMESSSFDGMEDMVMRTFNSEYRKVNPSEIDFSNRNTYGIDGLWLVHTRNFIENHGDIVTVYNSCGSTEFKIAFNSLE